MQIIRIGPETSAKSVL